MILEQSLLLLQERFGPDLLERAQQLLVRPREFERDPLRVGGSVSERGDRCVDGPAELRRDPVPRSLRHDGLTTASEHHRLVELVQVDLLAVHVRRTFDRFPPFPHHFEQRSHEHLRVQLSL